MYGGLGGDAWCGPGDKDRCSPGFGKAPRAAPSIFERGDRRPGELRGSGSSLRAQILHNSNAPYQAQVGTAAQRQV